MYYKGVFNQKWEKFIILQLKIGRYRIGRILKGVLKSKLFFEVIYYFEKGVMNGERINGFGESFQNK